MDADTRPPPRRISRILIANRGEIAVRILTTLRTHFPEIQTYTLSSPSDTTHTHHSNHTIPVPSAHAYVDVHYLINLAKQHRIDAIHPGYGFLSENADFAAQAWSTAQCRVIGPGPGLLARTGDKRAAKGAARAANVPVLPSKEFPSFNLSDKDVSEAQSWAQNTGFPIMVKAIDGGGGRGIRIVNSMSDLVNAIAPSPSTNLNLSSNTSSNMFLEKALLGPGIRHVEVQIIGDGQGNILHLHERECSIQRRYQKVIERAPSGLHNRAFVQRIIDAAVSMAKSLKWYDLGTWEFLTSEQTDEFWFLEINPRVQVEHTVTEEISGGGVDLIRVQLLLTQNVQFNDQAFDRIKRAGKQAPKLHSIQLRISAENVHNNWALSIGTITNFHLPSGPGLRVDTALTHGCDNKITSEFDSLIAKIIITATTWNEVVRRTRVALQDTWFQGIKTNLDILRGIVSSADFENGNCDTSWLERNVAQLFETGSQISQHAEKRRQHTPRNNQIIKSNDIKTPSQNQNQNQAQNQDTQTSQPRLATPSNPSHIPIPLSGKLISLHVDPNDTLQPGDTVFVIQQMKMEIEVKADRGGRAVWVMDVLDGEDVVEGWLGVEIELASGGQSGARSGVDGQGDAAGDGTAKKKSEEYTKDEKAKL